MSNELTTTNNNPYAIMPVMELTDALARRKAIVEFTKRLMVDKTDFGTIPGAGKKATLFKAGAEKLCTLFGLSPFFEPVEVVTDWTGKDHDGEAFFYYHYRCTLKRGDIVAGQGEGSCNSWEKKYRYRNVDARYATDEQKEQALGIEQTKWGQKYILPNPNPADTVNTIAKMAQKRALVAATLIAVNASEFFTQDIEDMDFGVIEGEFTTESEPPKKPARAQQQRPEPSQGAGGEQIPAWQQGLDEHQIKIGLAGGNEFFPLCVKFIPRYGAESAAKATARILGITKLSKDGVDRVGQFTKIRRYAQLRDANLPQDLAVDVVDGVMEQADAFKANAERMGVKKGEPVQQQAFDPETLDALNEGAFDN